MYLLPVDRLGAEVSGVCAVGICLENGRSASNGRLISEVPFPVVIAASMK